MVVCLHSVIYSFVQISSLSQPSQPQDIQVLLVLVLPEPVICNDLNVITWVMTELCYFYFCDLLIMLMMHDLHQCSVYC
jgi:hypothetical protein